MVYLSFTSSLRIWLKAITNPFAKTYVEIAENPDASWQQAFIWVGIYGLVSNLLLDLEVWAAGVYLNRPTNFSIVSDILVYPVLVIFVFFIQVLITEMVARMFGGKGNFEKFSFLVASFYVPMSLIHVVLFPFIRGTFLVYILYPYSGLLVVVAIRAAYKLSVGKTFLIAIISFIIIGVIFLVLLGVGLYANLK